MWEMSATPSGRHAREGGHPVRRGSWARHSCWILGPPPSRGTTLGFDKLDLRTDLSCLRRHAQIALEQAPRGALGLAGVAEDLALEGIETMRRREEAKAAAVAHDDARGLRADLDDIGIRHNPVLTYTWGINRTGRRKFLRHAVRIAARQQALSPSFSR